MLNINGFHGLLNGFPQSWDTPIAGWFISQENPTIKWMMMTGGTPIFGKAPYDLNKDNFGKIMEIYLDYQAERTRTFHDFVF